LIRSTLRRQYYFAMRLDLLHLARTLRRSRASAYWAARAFSGLIFPAAHVDVVSVIVPGAIVVIGGLGAALPAARRAARTDPMLALRSE